MKSKRQEEILVLIQEQNIETQNQLIEALRKRGVKSTQATLSRDIRELRLVKELTPDGGYRYTVPAREDSGDQLDRLRKIFRECVVSFDTAQNIVVIHTLPGLANAAASMSARNASPAVTVRSTSASRLLPMVLSARAVSSAPLTAVRRAAIRVHCAISPSLRA